MRRLRPAAGLAPIASILLALCAVGASASPPQSITIETVRERGLPGLFTVSGAMYDVGTFTTESVHFSAFGAPDFLMVHATYTFVGNLGSFTLRLEILERLTADPNVLVGDGEWALLEGTGAYADAHAQGEIHGIVDDNAEPDLFLRTYTGNFHLDGRP